VGFIDKALEKAKADKQKTSGNQASLAPMAPTVSPPEPPPFRAEPERALGGIRYSVTRTVPVRLDDLWRHRIITGDDSNAVREEYKILRTQILQRTQPQQKNTLMVTGPLPNEGKTLTAINLAISLSHEVDKTVLLVDADLRSPSVHSYFGLPSSPGLVDYLAGNASIPDLLIHPQGLDKLVLLPGGRPVAGAAELIGSPMMDNLVKELKYFYPERYVLFDLPPVLSYTDAQVFAPYVDGIILVVEMGKTIREDIQKSVELFKGFPVLGLVLNKVDNRERQCYYYCPEETDQDDKKKGLFGWIRS
jgi:exopolysaccharide/PEP-CTERM locus tyrosine autokinase